MSTNNNGQAGAVAAAVCVSQKNALAVLGMPPSRYLQFLRDARVPHACVGKLRIAAVEDVLRALSASAAANDVAPTKATVLALLGRGRGTS